MISGCGNGIKYVILYLYYGWDTTTCVHVAVVHWWAGTFLAAMEHAQIVKCVHPLSADDQHRCGDVQFHLGSIVVIFVIEN